MENLPQNCGLTAQELEEIRRYIQKYPEIHTAKIFGSRALGTYKEASDVDIAIFGDGVTDKTARDLKFDLEEESYLPYFFDVISYNDITVPSLREHIDRHAVKIYRQGWREVKIKDLGFVVTGKTPSSKFPEEFGNEMPFVTPSDYKYFRKWVDRTDRYLSKKGVEKLKNKILLPYSILVTCIGSDMGKVAMNKIPVVTNQQINSIVPNQKVIFPDFLYYKLVNCYETLKAYGQAGTAVPIINKGDFEQIDLEIPSSLDEQKAIADILSSLDDKIELLHRQNKTLEAMAEIIFRKWFVEEASDEKITVGELAEIDNENIKPGDHPTELFEHYSIPAFDNGKTPIIEQGKDILSNKFIVKPNTILVSKLNPITPRIWNIGANVAINSVCSTEFQVIKPLSQKYYYYLYFILKSKEVVSNLAMSATGTSGSHQRIRPEYILEVELAKPDKDKLALFNETFCTSMNKIESNCIQIRTLEKLRDTLLPKLISGEVRVKV